MALDLVLELVVDDDEVIRRLSGRRTCRGCGKIWHVEFDPTREENICDRCGSELFQRDDDKAETIANRLVEYARQDRAAGGLLRGPGQAGGHRRDRAGRGRHGARHRRPAVVRGLRCAVRQLDIQLKTPEQIELMRGAGLVVAAALGAMRDAVAPGVSTADLDAIAEKVIRDAGRGPVVQGLPRLSRLDLRLGQRAGRVYKSFLSIFGITIFHHQDNKWSNTSSFCAWRFFGSRNNDISNFSN